MDPPARRSPAASPVARVASRHRHHHRPLHLLLVLAAASVLATSSRSRCLCHAFAPSSTTTAAKPTTSFSQSSGRAIRRYSVSPRRVVVVLAASSSSSDDDDDVVVGGGGKGEMEGTETESEREARLLLERVRKMREEIAALEGVTVDAVEREAKGRRIEERERAERVEREREEREKARAEAASSSSSSSSPRHRSDDGRFLQVPETAEEQIRQASDASTRAFRDGLTRQILRFALLPEDETLMERERNWPGGAEQMYREAAGPMARAFLGEVRAPTSEGGRADPRLTYRPNVTAVDVWDFDGSALVSAEAATGAEDNVKALVFPNTDTKYTRDIARIDSEMGDRLFLLVNPFWRDLTSWGINILAPRGKDLAKEAIFDRDFRETYCLLQKTVRGEDCVALKAYPYDWQLYAYVERESWPYDLMVIRLGSTKEEPTAAEFGELLGEREEFKLSKNMRMMQRMRNNGR